MQERPHNASRRRRPLWAALALLVAGAAGGHHSLAAYDRDHLRVLSGVVRQYRFMNPHVRISMAVPDGTGGERVWELEGATASLALKQGLDAHTLRAGQRVSVEIAPRKDGTDGGEWQRILEIDGRPFRPRARAWP